MNGIIVIRNVSESDLELLVGSVVCLNNGDHVIVPEELYDDIPESIGNKYGLHHIDYSDQF